MKQTGLFLGALLVSSALTASAFAATKVGIVGAANPSVFATGENGEKRELKTGDAIYLNDALSTSAKGSAQLMFLDKSALTISPDSKVVIDTFVYNPKAKNGKMSLNGAKGAFRFIGGALTKSSKVDIKTPVSTIGIRGGIVDTHIAAGGETDAVFLFGKEMTMTNAQGVTSSATQFGSGLGLSDANAAPVSLPQNVVAARINNSPTQAAERAAPPASAAEINAIESKANVSEKSAASSDNNEGGNNSAGDAPSTGENNSDNDGNNNSDGSQNNNSNNETGSNNNAGANDQGGSSPATNGSADNAPSATETNVSADAPVADQPAQNGGGLPAGAGLKPLSETAGGPAVDAGLGSEVATSNVRDDVDEAVNPREGGTRPNGFEISDEQAENLNQRAQNAGLTVQPPGDQNDDSLIADSDLTDGAGLKDEQIEPPESIRDETDEDTLIEDQQTTNQILQTVSSITPPEDPLFGSQPWNSATPPTVGPSDDNIARQGRFVVHNDSAVSGGIMRAKVNSEGHFVSLGTELLAGNQTQHFAAWNKNESGKTETQVTRASFDNFNRSHEVYLENSNGEVPLRNGEATSLTTANNSFHYTMMEWDNPAGERQSMRYYFGASALPATNLSGLTAAQQTTELESVYADMLTESKARASGSQYIQNYSFLPTLNKTFDGNGNEAFGFMPFNAHAGFGGTANGTFQGAEDDNRYGLLVNYETKKYFSGAIDFTGDIAGSPGVVTAFGDVKDAANVDFAIVNDMMENNVALFKGEAFEWTHDAYINALNPSDPGIVRYSGETKVNAHSAFTDPQNKAIDALILTRDSGSAMPQRQAAVADNRAEQLAIYDPHTVSIQKGFTAGLMYYDDGTHQETGLIRTPENQTYRVELHTDTQVYGKINYEAVDNTSLIDDAPYRYFGTAAPNGTSAALQKNMYAASDEHGHNLMVAAGANASAGADSNGNPLGVCNSCEFAHWGVWATDFNTGTAQQTTGLVPYVAGEITPHAYAIDSATAGDWNYDANNDGQYDPGMDGIGVLGTVNYSGEALANMAISDANGTVITNEVGTMTARIDLSSRSIAADGLSIDFNGMAGESNRQLTIQNRGIMYFDNHGHTFTGPTEATYTDASGNLETMIGTGATNDPNHLSGAIFGPNAEEVGGQFTADVHGTNESIKAGGVFIGKR